MGKRSTVEPAKRAEVVLSLLRKEEPAVRIARRYGVSEPTLYWWHDEFLEGGQAALAGKKKGEAAKPPSASGSATSNGRSNGATRSSAN